MVSEKVALLFYRSNVHTCDNTGVKEINSPLGWFFFASSAVFQIRLPSNNYLTTLSGNYKAMSCAVTCLFPCLLKKQNLEPGKLKEGKTSHEQLAFFGCCTWKFVWVTSYDATELCLTCTLLIRVAKVTQDIIIPHSYLDTNWSSKAGESKWVVNKDLTRLRVLKFQDQLPVLSAIIAEYPNKTYFWLFTVITSF